MIFDKLKNIGTYKGLSANLDTAIDYILSHDLNDLALGKNVIDGDQVFVNVMEITTAFAEDKVYEMHKDYLDIQIDLNGAERLLTGDQNTMEMGEYNAAGDVSLGTATAIADCTIGPDNFVICMTGEPHMPGAAVDQPAPIKKCVFKVRW